MAQLCHVYTRSTWRNHPGLVLFLHNDTDTMSWRNVFTYVCAVPDGGGDGYDDELDAYSFTQIQQILPNRSPRCALVAQGGQARARREARRHPAEVPEVGKRCRWPAGEQSIRIRGRTRRSWKQVTLNPVEEQK